MQDEQTAGSRGSIFRRTWPVDGPHHVVVLVHGYGEHIGRYDHVAQALLDHGAAVYGLDHQGHGRSDGERVHIEDFADLTADLHRVVEAARADHPDTPIVMIGHSMGGLIATLYTEEHPDELVALVLSAPTLGRFATVYQLAAAQEIPDTPIDPDVLSRDPEVGRAYADDDLVYRGPFKRPTVQAWVTALERASADRDRIRIPVLHMHGDDDQLVPLGPSREAVAGFPVEAETHIYPSARHEVFNETNRDEVLGDVTAFINRVTAAAG
jgi:alpha-beta hydrolase superfamily lysophospholipase